MPIPLQTVRLSLKKVFVYWNVRNKKWSVRALEGDNKGRVVASTERILLVDAVFSVSQAGRRRVVETKKKNVHAGVIGSVEAVWGMTLRKDVSNKTLRGLAIGRPWPIGRGALIRYNPYETKTFVRAANGAPVTSAKRVALEGSQARATGIR
jgi:hypothetical protein